MDRKTIARELLAVARDLVAIDFPTKDALNKYLDDHPDADRGNHKVVETKKEVPKQAPKSPRVDNAEKSILEKYKGSDKEEFKDMGLESKSSLADTIQDELSEELGGELSSAEKRELKQRAKGIADKLWW